jgi:hypothetical protein
MNVAIGIEVVESAKGGVTIKAATISGPSTLVVRPETIFPVVPTLADKSGFWIGAWAEHRNLCPQCDRGNRPLCARAEEIAKHLESTPPPKIEVGAVEEMAVNY